MRLNRQQRMPAKRKEVVFGADLRQTKNTAPDPGKLFGNTLRGLISGHGDRSGPRRGGQRLAVNLAVGRQREDIERDEMRRHHMGGQCSLKRAAQGFGNRSSAQIADQPQITGRVLASHDHGLFDTGLRLENGFDLAQLYPVAAQFDLVIGTAEKFKSAVIAPAHKVSGAVHPAGVEGVGDEPF